MKKVYGNKEKVNSEKLKISKSVDQKKADLLKSRGYTK